MSTIVTLDEAQAGLRGLITGLKRGDEIVILDNKEPVARLIGTRSNAAARPAPGLGKGSVLYVAPDFDEIPEEFKEYLE